MKTRAGMFPRCKSLLFLSAALALLWVPAARAQTAEPTLHIEDVDKLTISEGAEPSAEALPPERIRDASNVAVLQSLNKVSARTSELEIAPNSIAHFGNLEILMIQCWKSPPEEKPEAAALLQIWEKRPNEMRQQLFLGWMFASSPGISALEHAVYDIRVLDCRPADKSPKSKP
jgi:hypothetical protein